MPTSVYIDGLNFFYGCLKGSRFKWLDYGAYCRAAMPNDAINRIRYFTAEVKADASDPGKLNRQLLYLRALATVPNLVIHKGRMANVQKRGILIDPKIPGVTQVKIKTREEKSTDVCLAAHLLVDAFRGRFDQAVVITNDSDLVEPIVLVQGELNLPVHVLSPCGPQSAPSHHLQQAATSFNAVDLSVLAACQFPATMIDATGRTITKPTGW